MTEGRINRQDTRVPLAHLSQQCAVDQRNNPPTTDLPDVPEQAGEEKLRG
ncbi:hypothetical protein [Tatumella terrea]|uniref:Uncharacterized protein n=1 Tax=Tatumella terrea TaxID=419007 RepID=A0ABW1W116_9GAMM